jgi:hypothetical protein
MIVKVKYGRALLQQIQAVVDASSSKKELSRADEAIGLGENYLYTNVRAKILVNKDLRLHDRTMKLILDFLGYIDFQEFKNKVDNPITKQLLSCAGEYYSYVRRNMDEGTVFRSPLRLYVENGRMKVEFKGGRLKYEGVVRIENGCLFIPLESKSGKAFYHIYSIGATETPRVLQGVFSGISNQYDPIAGRAVLVRTEEQFASLRNAELAITTLKKSKALYEKSLATYFSDRSRNNLWLNRPYAFDERDLVSSK